MRQSKYVTSIAADADDDAEDEGDDDDDVDADDTGATAVAAALAGFNAFAPAATATTADDDDASKDDDDDADDDEDDDAAAETGIDVVWSASAVKSSMTRSPLVPMILFAAAFPATRSTAANISGTGKHALYA